MIAATSTQDQTLIGIVGVMAVSMAGALTFAVKGWQEARKGAASSKGAYEAVNGVGPGQHRLYDAVSHIADAVERLEAKQQDFDNKGWATGLGGDIDTAPKLTEAIRTLQHQQLDHQAILDKLEALDVAVRDHVIWEMNQKYDGGAA